MVNRACDDCGKLERSASAYPENISACALCPILLTYLHRLQTICRNKLCLSSERGEGIDGESSLLRSGRVIAVLATCTSLLLALFPGVLAMLTGQRAEYDAALAVLTATLVAVIWYTQFTFEALHLARTRDFDKRQRARRTLATGLLDELSWLDGLLCQVIQHGPHTFYNPFSHPILEQAIVQNTLFEPETISLLSRFHALLRDLRASVNEYRSQGALLGGQRSEYRHFCQAKAFFSIRALPALVSARETEGGTRLPRDLGESLEGPNFPPLPPSVFDRPATDHQEKVTKE